MKHVNRVPIQTPTTREVVTYTCDYCGRTAHHKCEVCGKDICTNHRVPKIWNSLCTAHFPILSVPVKKADELLDTQSIRIEEIKALMYANPGDWMVIVYHEYSSPEVFVYNTKLDAETAIEETMMHESREDDEELSIEVFHDGLEYSFKVCIELEATSSG